MYRVLVSLLLLTCLATTTVAQQNPVPSVSIPAASRHNVSYMRQPDFGALPVPERERLPSFIQSLSGRNTQFEVLLGQGRLLTLAQDLSEPGKPSPVVAVGDPTVIDFDIVGPRHIRVYGLRLGATDLSIITGDLESFSMEVQVVLDLDVVGARIRSAFPDAQVELSSLRQNIIVEGQARDPRQVAQIIELVEGYILSVQVRSSSTGQVSGGGGGASQDPLLPPTVEPDPDDPDALPPVQPLPEAPRPVPRSQPMEARVINLLRVPGPQQVVLKVQIAELNRTAYRQLSTSMLIQNGTGVLGSTIGPAFPPVLDGGPGLLGLLDPVAAPTSSIFGILDSGNVAFLIQALRQNQVLTILAEPNLVAMHGQEATFLAGGEFPVPVPQPGSAAGLVTIEYRSFGVGLSFVPFILDDETIRLAVAPEVSALDFSAGIELQGTAVPGLSTRRTSTVVQLREGQTLAIAGILQVELQGSTSRIPGLGDLPYIGMLFRNTSSQTVEKELVVLVTPHLVEAIYHKEIPMLPGEDVLEPTDHELYLNGRIEKRSWQPYRATAAWDDPLGIEHRRQLESKFIYGPHGYSE